MLFSIGKGLFYLLISLVFSILCAIGLAYLDLMIFQPGPGLKCANPMYWSVIFSPFITFFCSIFVFLLCGVARFSSLLGRFNIRKALLLGFLVSFCASVIIIYFSLLNNMFADPFKLAWFVVFRVLYCGVPVLFFAALIYDLLKEKTKLAVGDVLEASQA